MSTQRTPTHTTPVQFIRPAALAQRWGCSVTTLWRERERGRLPAPTRITPGTIGWRLDIIERIEAERTPTEAA